jgi:hypothetical protein
LKGVLQIFQSVLDALADNTARFTQPKNWQGTFETISL